MQLQHTNRVQPVTPYQSIETDRQTNGKKANQMKKKSKKRRDARVTYSVHVLNLHFISFHTSPSKLIGMLKVCWGRQSVSMICLHLVSWMREPLWKWIFNTHHTLHWMLMFTFPNKLLFIHRHETVLGAMIVVFDDPLLSIPCNTRLRVCVCLCELALPSASKCWYFTKICTHHTA